MAVDTTLTIPFYLRGTTSLLLIKKKSLPSMLFFRMTMFFECILLLVPAFRANLAVTTAWVSTPAHFRRLHRHKWTGNRKLPTLGASSSGDQNGESQDSLWTKIESLLSVLDDGSTSDANIGEILTQSGGGNTSPSIQKTQVYIIGTGLSEYARDLPLSTLAILVQADVVLYDALSLLPSEILRVVPSHCVVQSVGKRGDKKESAKQKDIDSLILQLATGSSVERDQSSGNDDGAKTTDGGSNRKIVVRLKGGDPFLFGRSRTEVETLQQNSIPYEVIPNLSSCVAGPHAAGIPLTDPLLNAQSFAVFSGTTAAGVGLGSTNSSKDGTNKCKRVSSSIDWSSLTVDTLVFLMIGRLDKLEDLCQTLAESGEDGTLSSSRWKEDTPCAIVRNAGRPNKQEAWRATLGTLVDVIRQDLDETVTTVSPAILVVGPTASLDLLSEISELP